jgi:hypothetical protein
MCYRCEISSSHGGEYDVQSCLLGCTAVEAVRTSETSVDNLSTRQYNPEDSSEQHVLSLLNYKKKSILMFNELINNIKQ